MTRISLARIGAVLVKELIQMKRDRLTFAMMLGVPLMQLFLFGFAINTDPKDLPTALAVADQSRFARTLTTALQNSGYFRITHVVGSRAEVERLIATGAVSFAVTIPDGFGRTLLRGQRPQLLIEADATDPAAASNAVAAAVQIGESALARDLIGPLAALNAGLPSFETVVHRRYNPEGITQYNIVPGLLGVILTLTLVMMTAVALTRELERGTMENLLAMPVKPIEVMLGKIAPYIGVGFVQVVIVLSMAWLVFDVPMIGSLALLLAVILLFIAALTMLGYTFSTVARTQMQALQMSVFFFLPSLMLSGFMFPFRGMPGWAQMLGEIIPLTYFLRVVRGIMLKGTGWNEIAHDVWPLGVFLLLIAFVALKRYRTTLDAA
ncbi:ABC transporter permease [Vineibacter terrae]|uniref:ABC transporter permease n=1 Tax=Vineibacter terrae TaxID=2586908 RepID=A0A5C8PI24_9HYPH|nr:ABC transporter permease [Vineibacter terrae]TXL73453.1 ABC transporter permease [Vineibacter terrae]